MVLHLFCNQVTAVRFCHGAPNLLGVSLVWPKALDFDSMITGSNPVPSAKHMVMIVWWSARVSVKYSVAGSIPPLHPSL